MAKPFSTRPPWSTSRWFPSSTSRRSKTTVYVWAARSRSQGDHLAEAAIAEKPASQTAGLRALVEHFKVVANHQVRNVASLAGNLFLATNLGFLSDVALVLATLGARARVVFRGGERECPVLEIPKDAESPPGALTVEVFVPYSAAGDFFRSFKIRRRSEDCHAIVNAGFRVGFGTDGKVVSARLFLNGIAAGYTAQETKYGIPFRPIALSAVETALVGRSWDEATLRLALGLIPAELEPYRPPQDAHGVPYRIDGIDFEYRAELASTLFYKFFVGVALERDPRSVPPSLRSAGLA
ncbi:MAG: hypothetical protein HC897_06555, partial [Thermoanaerobaculia bacterium]|nr:hypothetical protein [Thermoanaerobaculia bacterium]